MAGKVGVLLNRPGGDRGFARSSAANKDRHAAEIDKDLRGAARHRIRGRRPGEAPVPARPIQQYADFSSHDAWGTDHFGFLYQGNLETFCAELRGRGVNGSLLCYVAAPDGVSIELMQC